MSNVPDYYSILKIPCDASHDDIREAYKKQALLSHPDRLPKTATHAEREEATREFQLIADAYYILGDRSRKKSYDKSRAENHGRFASFASAMPNTSTTQANQIFGNIFEELLKPEVEHPSHVWRVFGACSGAVLGFIIGNVPGAAVGALAGKTLGQVRDHKGVSVYTAFQKLNMDQRRDILTGLLAKFVTAGASGMMK
ncbi:DnaJ domain-containing protein [Parasitella parasitica]|nr:DnaJ domain-containing protein [Parasitella parasitica]